MCTQSSSTSILLIALPSSPPPLITALPSLHSSSSSFFKEGKYIANYFSTLIRRRRAGEMAGWRRGEGGRFFLFFFKPFDKLTRLWISSLAGRRWNNLQADLCVKRICRFSSFLYRLVGETADVDGQSNRPLIESLTKSGAVIKHGRSVKLDSLLLLLPSTPTHTPLLPPFF